MIDLTFIDSKNNRKFSYERVLNWIMQSAAIRFL